MQFAVSPAARRWMVCAGFTLVAPPAHAASPITLLPLGDSITAGGGVNENDNGGYRTQLVTQLTGDNHPVLLQGSEVLVSGATGTPAVLSADNGQGLHYEGHGGYTLSQLDNNLEGSDPTTTDNNGGFWLNGAGGRGSPSSTQFVLVHAGTNDILQLYGSHSEADPISNSDLLPIETRMVKLVTDLRADLPGARLLIASLIPIPDPFYDSKITGDNITFTPDGQNDYELNHYVILYDQWIQNTLIPLFAAGGNVSYVDEYDSQINSSGGIIGYSDYGVHPDTAGYDLMGTVWANAIEAAIVPEPTTIALPGAGVVGLLVRRRRQTS